MASTKAPSGYKLKQEEVPLPGTRKDRAELLTTLLESGGVQKLTAEVGKPIRLLRWMKSDGTPEVDILSSEFMLAVRNAEMEEFTFADKIGHLEYLAKAFSLISGKMLKPRAILVKKLDFLADWSGIPNQPHGELFGVPTMFNSEVPEGVLLLVASDPEDPDEVAFSLKLWIDLPKEKK